MCGACEDGYTIAVNCAACGWIAYNDHPSEIEHVNGNELRDRLAAKIREMRNEARRLDCSTAFIRSVTSPVYVARQWMYLNGIPPKYSHRAHEIEDGEIVRVTEYQTA